MDDSRVIWLTCPDCGSKIGLIVSLGKAQTTKVQTQTFEESEPWPPGSYEDQLKGSGIDVNLLNIEEKDEVIIISPKKFLGDQWSTINEVIRNMGGVWIREGRDSRWEIKKEQTQS
jgi:hypothetical protein